MMSRNFQIQFRVNYCAHYSYALYLSGNIEELGCWDPLRARRMTWNEANWWSINVNGLTQGQFDYKFFVAKYDNPTEDMKWEQGPNRSINASGYQKDSISICDVWEYKKIIFRLFENTRVVTVPSAQTGMNSSDSRNHSSSVSSNSSQSTQDSENSSSSVNPEVSSLKERFYIVGDIEQLGNMQKIQKMKKFIYRVPLNDKEGTMKEITLWEKQILVKTSQQSLRYKYAYKSENGFDNQLERKSRKINFSKNDVDFQGAFCFSDKWQKNDFDFDNIDSRIFVGPYPQNMQQITQLSEIGIKAIFNVQTHDDMESHGINWESVKQQYKSCGIKAFHFPINDMDVIDMAIKLRDAVENFADVVQKYEKVYIHCTSGIFRSPQIVIGYLHLYQQIDINKAVQLVESKRPQTKKNRDYLRQIYAIKGGYGRAVKQYHSTNSPYSQTKYQSEQSQVLASSENVHHSNKNNNDSKKIPSNRSKLANPISHSKIPASKNTHASGQESLRTLLSKKQLSHHNFNYANLTQSQSKINLSSLSFFNTSQLKSSFCELPKRRHSLFNSFQFENMQHSIWA